MLRTLLLLAALGAACATPPRALPRPEGAYGDAFAAATRDGAVAVRLEPRAYVYATRETAAFRAARTKELARLFQAPESEADAHAPAVTAPLDGEVFVVAVRSEHAGAFFDPGRPDSSWALALTGPQGRVVPASAARLDGGDPTVRALYPYVDRFYAVYRVAFPAGAGDGALALVLSGPGGSVSLAV